MPNPPGPRETKTVIAVQPPFCSVILPNWAMDSNPCEVIISIYATRLEPSPCCRCTGPRGWVGWGLTSRSLATLAACCCLCDSSVLESKLASHSLHHSISNSYHVIPCCITSYHINIPYHISYHWFLYFIDIVFNSMFVPVCLYLFCPWLLFHTFNAGARFTYATGHPRQEQKEKMLEDFATDLGNFKGESGRQTQGQDIILKSLSCSLACCLLIKNLGVWTLLVVCEGHCNMFQCVVSRWKPSMLSVGSACVVYRKIMLIHLQKVVYGSIFWLGGNHL